MSRSALAFRRGLWHSGQFLMLITRSKASSLLPDPFPLRLAPDVFSVSDVAEDEVEV
jgi:hypothetical protein